MIRRILNQKNLVELSGILLPRLKNGNIGLSLLTHEGEYYRIHKNRMYKKVEAKEGECVRVTARIVEVNSRTTIDVVSIVSEFENASMDDTEVSATPVAANCAEFVDYNSIYI